MVSDEDSSNISPFKTIFDSQSIAVIGASDNPNKLGFRIVRNLIKQGKTVYPINPHISTLLDKKVYPTVKDVSEDISLAVIILSPKLILDIVDDCGAKGIKYIVIVAEGFRETGPDGAKLQEDLKNKLRRYEIRAIGPNTMGFHDVYNNFSTCFLDVSDLKPGKVAISSQTGVLAGAFLKYINLSENVGISKVIDLGNMIDLNHADVLEFLMNDEKTEIIAMHIEGLDDGQRFSSVLSKVTAKKPVIIVKGGVMPETKRVVESHTGSLVGDTKIFRSMVKKAGAVLVENFEEFVDVIKGFNFMAPPKGDRVAIISGSGGTAVITIDSLMKNGLQLAKFSDHTLLALKKYIPEQGKILNPVDIWPAGVQHGLSTIYSEVISILNGDPQVDIIIALLFRIRDFRYDPTPIIEKANACVKSVFFATMGHIMPEICGEIEESGIPTYAYGVKIAKVLNYMWEYRKFIEREKKEKRIN